MLDLTSVYFSSQADDAEPQATAASIDDNAGLLDAYSEAASRFQPSGRVPT